MSTQWTAGVLTATGSLFCGAVLALLGDGSGPVLRFGFLLLAPALAVAVAMRSLDPLARVVLALSATVVVNTLVAETMLIIGSWSLPVGTAAVAVISALVAAAPLAVEASPGGTVDDQRGVSAGSSSAQHPAEDQS